MKFYPSDWRADAKLRMCSIGARGLWIEMLCVMHEAEPYGYLLSNGNKVTTRQMATLAGITISECMKYMLELVSAGVYSLDDDAVIFSRRMVRDKAKAETDRLNGRHGGNPRLRTGVNPPLVPEDKAQRPEARSQTEATASVAAHARASRLPDDWSPTGVDIAFAISKGLGMAQIEIEAVKFRNYWTSKGGKDATKTSWPRTWQNWILNAKGPRGGEVFPARPLTSHQRERATGREILDDLGDFISGSGQADLGILRHDPGDGSEGVHGGVRGDVVVIPSPRLGKGG